MIGAVVLLFILSFNVFTEEVRGFFASVSSPLQASLWQTGQNISIFLGGGELKAENEALRQENFSLKSQVVELEDTKRENEELRKALDLKVQKDFTIVRADIIGKNVGEDVIILRGGQELGIQEGMPVITSAKVVVGRVFKVLSGHSTVQLLSHKESRFDAKIPTKLIAGVIRGQGRQRLVFDLVPQEAELAVRDMVVTSNLGDIFPENLLVGEITEILKTGADPFQKASVKPFFDLRSAETLFIITSSQ